MKNRTKKTVAATVLSFALLFQAAPSLAAPTYDQKIEDLQTKIQKYDNEIIESINNVQKLTRQVEDGQKRVETAKKEIEELEASYNRTLELSKSRLESIQKSGSTSLNFMEILLTSNGISDFVQKTSAVMTIMESDKQLSESLLKKDEELKAKKEKLDKELSSIKNKQEQAKKEKLTIQRAKTNVQADLKAVQEAKKQAEEAQKRAEEQRRQAAAAAQAARTTQQQVQSTTPVQTTSNDSSSSQSKPSNNTSDHVNVPNNASGSASAVIAEAKKYLGVKYVWGGTTPSGFDCSGFTSYVFRTVGVSLPRVSRDQQNFGTKISTSQVQPGDLVFKGKPAYHVGIYIGGGKYIHAPQTGDVVKISSYKPSKFSSATRVLN